MRHTDGSDLLVPGDSRITKTAVLHVGSQDSRQNILTAIAVEAKAGRDYVVILLPEKHKVFTRSVDFEGMSNAVKEIDAHPDLIFVTENRKTLRNAARWKFLAASSLEDLKNNLSSDPASPAPLSSVPASALAQAKEQRHVIARTSDISSRTITTDYRGIMFEQDIDAMERGEFTVRSGAILHIEHPTRIALTKLCERNSIGVTFNDTGITLSNCDISKLNLAKQREIEGPKF